MKECIECGSSYFQPKFEATSPDKGDSFTIEGCVECGLTRTKLPENFESTPYYEETNYYAREKSLLIS